MLFGFAARDIPFVVRMIAGTTTDFAEVAAFMASGKADAEIDFIEDKHLIILEEVTIKVRI